MPSRKFLFRFGAFFCAIVILFAAAETRAQTKIYNINQPQSAVSAPVSAPVPAAAQPMPVMAQPVAMPPPPPVASTPASAERWLGQPLGNLSQPPLMNNQPTAFTANQPTQMIASQPVPMQSSLPAPIVIDQPPPMQAYQPVPLIIDNAGSSTASQPAPTVARQPDVVVQAPPVSVPSDLTEAQPLPEFHPTIIASTVPQPPIYRTPQPQSQPANVNLAVGPPMTMATRTGIDFGPQVSGYRYHQASPSTTIDGPRFGGVMTGTFAYKGFFVAADGRYSAGWLDYSGSGDLDSRLNTLWEARGLVGVDFPFMYFSVSPYAGFGYREVTDHLDGVSSTNTHLPLIENQLYYVPVGVHPRVPIDDQSRFTSTLEYDFIVHGQEVTHFNDTGNGDPTVRNEQPGGFGVHVDLMYETPYWSFGPFGTFWSVSTSKASVYHSPGSTCGATTCSFTQPASHTIEGGLQFKVHFF